MEVILVMLLVGAVIAGVFFSVTRKAEKQEKVQECELCQKCVKSLEGIVGKILELKKGKISSKDFEVEFKKFKTDLDFLVEEAQRKELPENILYALRDAKSRLESFSFSSDTCEKELRGIGSILEEVKGKLEKIEVIEKGITLPDDIVEKAYKLNKILAKVDIAVITASLKDTNLIDLAKKLDEATLLSKEIAERLRK